MTPDTNPYIAEHTPRELIDGIDAIPDAFHDVLEHEWNVHRCASIVPDTDHPALSWSTATVATIIEFEFTTPDDAHAFRSWARDNAPGFGLMNITFDAGMTHAWTRATVTCEFVGQGVASSEMDTQHSVCDSFVHFAEALVADRLPKPSGTYSLNADQLSGTTNPHANGDGYHATGFVDPADDPETIAGAIRTTGDELDAAREAIIENIELVLDAAGIDESEIREELDGDDAATPDFSCEPQFADVRITGGELVGEKFTLPLDDLDKRAAAILEDADDVTDEVYMLAEETGLPPTLIARELEDGNKETLERLAEIISGQPGVEHANIEDTEVDPKTCPDCGSTNSVGFDTGDRVCRDCNNNWIPDEDTGEDK